MGMMLHRHSQPVKEVKAEKTVKQPKVVKDTNKKPKVVKDTNKKPNKANK